MAADAIFLKVPKKKAEEAKKELFSKNRVDSSKQIFNDDLYVYFPLKNAKEKFHGFETVKAKAKQRTEQGKILPAVLEKLSIQKTAFDVLGEIIIVELLQKLGKRREKLLGEAILKSNPSARAVFKKASRVKGVHRTRKFKLIAGKGSTETTYRENGCTFKFNISKVFFTERLCSERLRVASQIMEKEKVLDMFSGVGPFAVLIAKKQPSAKIYAIDINKNAIHYLRENVRINKVSDKIIIMQGDAIKIVKKHFRNFFDRVIMNLPKLNKNFLSTAVYALKKRGILNYYTFAKTNEEVKEALEKELKKLTLKKFRVLNIRKVKPYSPYVWTFAADIEIKK